MGFNWLTFKKATMRCRDSVHHKNAVWWLLSVSVGCWSHFIAGDESQQTCNVRETVGSGLCNVPQKQVVISNDPFGWDSPSTMIKTYFGVFWWIHCKWNVRVWSSGIDVAAIHYMAIVWSESDTIQYICHQNGDHWKWSESQDIFEKGIILFKIWVKHDQRRTCRHFSLNI